jgi:hypothetical protein
MNDHQVILTVVSNIFSSFGLTVEGRLSSLRPTEPAVASLTTLVDVPGAGCVHVRVLGRTPPRSAVEADVFAKPEDKDAAKSEED